MPKSVDPVREAVLKTYRMSKETLEGCYVKGTWQRKKYVYSSTALDSPTPAKM